MSQPVPIEKRAESSASHSQQRYSLPPFLKKTYEMVDDPQHHHLISWNKNGTGFIVWHVDEFARDLLPKHFKHNNFASFVRQLNSYGFKKVVGDKWEFANDNFKRGEKRLLLEIQRKKVSPASSAIPVRAVPVTSSGNSSQEQVVSSNALLMSTSAAPTVQPAYNSTAYLTEENAWLRKENAALKLELERWRGLCGNVANMIATFAGGGIPMQSTNSTGGMEAEKNQGLQLFGVAIGPNPCRNERVEKSGE